MKALLLSVFCALVMNVQAMEIKKDTIDQYIIDKKVIERFDGTQLEGKTILKYIIAYKDAGNTVQNDLTEIFLEVFLTLLAKPK